MAYIRTSRGVRTAAALVWVVAAGCKKDDIKSATPQAAVDTAVVASDSVVFPVVFPDGPAGAAARRGLAILSATRDSMPAYVGADLRCFSCHLDQGRRPNAVPLTGAYVRYPNYTTRDDRVISIQDRVNNCFNRSLAGRSIPVDGDQMNAIIIYLAVMSRNVAVGSHVPGEGLPKLAMLAGNPSRGATIFSARCARCHGADGQGIPPATPLWGPRSYSIGASLARLERAATFIRHNMPFDSAGVLNDQQSFDVAAFVLTHARPDSPGKTQDWADGGAPLDVPYDTRGHRAFHPPPSLPHSAR